VVSMLFGVPRFGLLTGMGILLLAHQAGRRSRADYCVECVADLGPHDVICPGCSGSIVGAINHPNERLDAQERRQDGETLPPF
jgi:hypothetical protein